MWTEHFRKIENAAQLVIGELNALSLRSSTQLINQDIQLLDLWLQNSGPGKVNPAIIRATEYLKLRHAEMIERFRTIDMFHLMLSVYAVGDFEIYLRDVHGVGSVEHPLISTVRHLSSVKMDIATAYSPNYDESDAAISKELSRHNPWSDL